MRYKVVYVYPWKSNCIIQAVWKEKYILSQGQYRDFKIIGWSRKVKD